MKAMLFFQLRLIQKASKIILIDFFGSAFCVKKRFCIFPFLQTTKVNYERMNVINYDRKSSVLGSSIGLFALAPK